MKPRSLKILLVSLLSFSVLVYLFFMVPLRDVLAETENPSDDDVNRIAKQLFCPVCENVPLDECQTKACKQWRDLIRQKLEEGWEEDEIKTFFVDQFGDRVLGEPPRRGGTWLLYVLPPAVFFLGLGLLVIKLSHGRGTSDISEYIGDDPYLEQVELDLEKLGD